VAAVRLDFGEVAEQVELSKARSTSIRAWMEASLRSRDATVNPIRRMVKASIPDFPSLVNIVWRWECITKSAGKLECPANFVPVEVRETGMKGRLFVAGLKQKEDRRPR
jgi:hypothetical protein